MPTITPDDRSRATELAFTDGDWLGDALPPDDFAGSDLGLTGAGLEAPGVLAAAATGLEDGPEVAPWLAAAMPGALYVGLRGMYVRLRPRYKGNGCFLRW
jgi:hypothetical protein